MTGGKDKHTHVPTKNHQVCKHLRRMCSSFLVEDLERKNGGSLSKFQNRKIKVFVVQLSYCKLLKNVNSFRYCRE